MTYEATLQRRNWQLAPKGLVPHGTPVAHELGTVRVHDAYGEICAPMDYLPEHGAHWRKIVNEIARERRVPASYIMGIKKWRPVAQARAECYYRIKNEVISIKGRPVTWYQIAKWMGRDDSTIIEMYRRHADRLIYAASQARSS